MTRIPVSLVITLVALLASLSLTAAAPARAHQLDNIKAAGVLRVATFDSNPPFGSVDSHSLDIVGYDVDFAKTIAAPLGVRARFVATNPANRIPLLQSDRVDTIVADITITPERAKVIDFSIPYFLTGQQLLVPAASPDDLDAYANARIGAVKGTTGERELTHHFPNVRVLAYDDMPLALASLRNGNVQAITQDSTILVGPPGQAPDKAKYKLLPELHSREEIGIGVRQGQPALLSARRHRGSGQRPTPIQRATGDALPNGPTASADSRASVKAKVSRGSFAMFFPWVTWAFPVPASATAISPSGPSAMRMVLATCDA